MAGKNTKIFELVACWFLIFTVSALCDGLKIFGQDFFSNMNLATSESARFIPEKYFLGTGDQIEISVWGPVEFRQQAEIDREGNILIPRIGKLYLSGKSLTQAKKYLQDMFDRNYKNVKVELTLIKGRLIPVFVMGEIIRPGAYVITSSSTILEVIAMAGGINARGSLRKIVVISKDGTKKEIDLYPTLFGGTLPEIYFQPEDIVYVPLSTNYVGIKGAVRRPAIYEFKGEISLADLIEYAGGFLPEADTKRIAIFRNDPTAGKKIIDFFLQDARKTELKNFVLSDGDEVEISFLARDIIEYVSIVGTIKNRWKYEWKPDISDSEIIKETDILPDTLGEQAEIIREKPDGAREIIQFSLIDAVKKVKDIELKPRDRVVVRSKERPVKKVTISGEVKFPGEYMISPGETLSSLIKRAGGFTEQAYLPAAVFTRVSVKKREKQEIEKFIMEKQATIEKEAGRIESEEEKALIEKSKGLLKQLAQAPVTGRVVVCLEPWEKFAGSDADITLEDGDVINIPTKPTIVSVVGEVNHPANVLYVNGADYKYYIEKAGSFTKNADVKNIFVVKANGTATTNLKKIEPGDVIVVGFLAKDRLGKILKDILQMLYYVKMIVD
ncbi:MAG: SLBB domain-containing protein [Candidatus Omnitrophica bacterium]|nr:SLBB domain-containing protein [Candidatus Omnitrophota bacterium]